MNYKSELDALLKSQTPLIRETLRDPAFDVESSVAAGDIILSPRLKPAYRPIISTELAGEPAAVMIRKHLWLRHVVGADALDHMRLRIAQGVTSFTSLLAEMRVFYTNSNMSHEKSGRMGSKVVAGRELIPRPYFGQWVYMDPRLSPQLHHLMVQRTFSDCLTPDIDAVLDVGSGSGDILTELAASTPHRNIAFYGAEVALRGQECLRIFADSLGNRNIRSVDFDLNRPDFGFLTGHRNILVISHGSLVYADRFPAGFWESLLGVAPKMRFALFEPISFCLQNDAVTPLFDRARAKNYGFTDALYLEIQRLTEARLIELQELTPDMTGPNPFFSLTLIRFQKHGRPSNTI